MNIKINNKKIRQLLLRVPLAYKILLGVLLLYGGIYMVLYSVPRSAAFTYKEDACIHTPIIAPAFQKSSSDAFSVSFHNELKIGDIALFATRACFTPTTLLTQTAYTGTISPFAGWFAAVRYTITAEEAPVAHTKDLQGTPLSTIVPFSLKLSKSDAVHSYFFSVAGKKITCNTQDVRVSCDVAGLQLDHGQTYTALLQRGVGNSSPETLFKGEVTTLAPLAVRELSIKDGQTVYDIPQVVTVHFDHEVKTARASITSPEGERTLLNAQLNKQTVEFTLPVDMPRKTTYTLTLEEVIGQNNSTLVGKPATTFTLSGGPRVEKISIGAGNVPPTSKAIITFDQPIDATVDVNTFITVSGVPVAIRRTTDRTVELAILDAGLCQAFTVSIAKGLKSGVNNEVSDGPWRHTSRTTCGSVATIGYSVQGRPLVAYYFGSGSSTILFTAAIHGNEPSSYATMMGWIQYLQSNAHTLPAGKQVVIVPNLNPDGLAAGTRNNSRNVNLGRNYPTANWRADIETASGVLKEGGGTTAGSEPETQALLALTRQLRPRLAVSFHAQGSLVGANKFGDSIALGDIYAATVKYRTMFYNAEAVMGYAMTGEYEDWMGEELGIPALLIELPALSGNYFSAHLTALLKMLNS